MLRRLGIRPRNKRNTRKINNKNKINIKNKQRGLQHNEQVILYKEECFAIQGAIFEVYRTMGSGFLEAVYQECLEMELASRKIPFQSQDQLALFYKETQLLQMYWPDLICYEKIIVELKAVKNICDDHRAQVFNYLKATGMRLALLVNFGHYPKATVERIVL